MKKFGEVYDTKDVLIGRFLYLDSNDQNLFNDFCHSWLSTHESDDRFFITIDIETTGLNHRKDTILLISISWDGKQGIVFDPRQLDLTHFKEVLSKVPISNHNIKFDAKFLMHKYGVNVNICFDTMVAAQMGWAGAFPAYGSFTPYSLGNLCKVLLNGISMDKKVRMEFVGMDPNKEFTQEQIEYAVIDALLTHRLVYIIKKRLHNCGLIKNWEEIELPLINHWAQSEMRGVFIDINKLSDLLDEKERELNVIYKTILNELAKLPKLPKYPKDIFNPNSTKQIVDTMQELGVHLPNCQEDTLSKIAAESGNTLLQSIIEHRKTKSVLSKFLVQWLERHIDMNTKTIHTNFNVYGAETGRFCVSKDTLVRTNKGYLPISELAYHRDVKLILDNEEVPYSKTIYKGKEEMYDFKFDDGTSLTATLNHQIFDDNTYKTTQELLNESNSNVHV